MDPLWKMLSDFVEEVCQGRDESHGHTHMKCVAFSALNIFEELLSENSIPVSHIDYIRDMVIICAWLHDVADRKYDKDGILKNKLKTFLDTHFDNYATLIMKIIDRVSFSNQINQIKLNGKTDWLIELGDFGVLIRNIVSDADKLEAIGKIGVERVVKYTNEKYFLENGTDMPHDLLVRDILAHSQEKLLRLKDEFIMTKPGKKAAIPLHIEFVEGLELLTK